MATQITISLDTRRAKTDGSYPLIFRLSHQGKTTSIRTGHTLMTQDWDTAKRVVKRSYPKSKDLNNRLQKAKAAMIDQIAALQEQKRLDHLSVAQLKQELTPRTETKDFFVFADRIITDLRAAKRIGTAQSYADTLKMVRHYLAHKKAKPDTLPLYQLNLDLLNGIETWHLSKGNAMGGLAVYMRTLRAIYNRAIKAGLVESDSNPFLHYTIRNGKPRKRAISIDAIQKLKTLELNADERLYFHRQVFLLSFYLRGMPFADLAHLTSDNIMGDHIHYNRQKTNEPMTVKIPPQAQEIIDQLAKEKTENTKSPYLLNVIKRTTPQDQYKDITWARQRFNKALKTLAQMAGIDEKLSSYTARHSYASIADDMEIPLTAISQMLGHQKISTTQAYLANLKKSKLDQYQDKVIDGV